MKRTLVITALVLVISLSLIAGTLAMYVVKIDNLAEGSVVAKEFILLEGETDTFAYNEKIAPGETVNFDFSVKNYDDSVVSETAMELDFAINVGAVEGKTNITPLTVTVKYKDGGEIQTTMENNVVVFDDSFPLQKEGQEKTYTVSVYWPSDNTVDIDYAGAGYGTSLIVSVTGTQVAP